jgi:hypothetical protein
MKFKFAAAIFILAATPALAHRLDEYLQNTIISVEPDRIHLQMTLTPGVAILPRLLATIDADGDGAISDTEQRAYAEAVLRDITLTVDSHRLTPRLVSLRFPEIDRLEEGLGDIRLEMDAHLPPGTHHRKFIFENHHQSSIAAYQVNCLVPVDPGIRIAAQRRDYLQSRYELEYEHADIHSSNTALISWTGRIVWLGVFMLLMLAQWVFRLKYGHPLQSQEASSVRVDDPVALTKIN